jgi:aspartyl-tRNA(Asn)/glutamyl-tRNA(Gln) amidotransferase subunit A
MKKIPTIAEASNDIAAGRLSPVELAGSCLARIEAGDSRIHSFIALNKERAMNEARAAEAAIKVGNLLGPLHGIPFAHKDIYGTAGIATTAHSRLLQDYIPDTDAFTVDKLAKAGVTFFGKLATHEFAWGGPSFDLPWPPVRNPWNTTQFSGGSSSGTGGAVAAGFVLGGTGTDTGGSIRQPAAYCGLAGIKPTYGLLSRSGIQPLAFTMDHAGPLAWTVEDCAILLQVMAGHDPADPGSANVDIPDFRAALDGDITGLRIGVARNFFERDTTVSNDVGMAMEASLGTFSRLGAEIRDVTLPSLHDWFACGMLIMISEAYSVHEPWLLERYNDYGEFFRDRSVLGAFITSADYMAAIRKRRELRTALANVMQDVDVIVLPTTATSAPRIDAMKKYASFETPSFTMPFNVAGTPALSVCNGYGSDGLPLGLQIVGRPFEDATVLRVGHAYERATPWRERRPEL